MYRGMGRDEARDMAATSLRRLNIGEHLWDVHVSVLSGGEKQRFRLARVFLRNTPLVILDEPFEHLSETQSKRLYLEIEKHCTGKTLIIISHQEVTWAQDRIVLSPN